MHGYQDLERKVIELFNSIESIIWRGNTYSEIIATKPTTSSGECKTDVYVSLRENGIETDAIKITVKKDNADFLANKLKDIDAENLLGTNWSSILVNSIASIQQIFLQEPLIELKPKSNPTELYIKLGWKLEVTNVARNLSVKLNLLPSEIIDYIYRGTNQPIERIHAYVNGIRVMNSGVADYILQGSSFHSVQHILDNLILLEANSFIPPDTYLVFTANNYRLIRDSADGPRALAIAIEWGLDSRNKLVPTINFAQPLVFTGQRDMMPILKANLAQIGITSDTFDETNIKNLRISDIY